MVLKNALKMGNYTIFGGFENPRRGSQARYFTTNVPKIVDLKSSSEQIFSKKCCWVPLFNENGLTGKSGPPQIRWTSFFETFPVGPSQSIEVWTEISGILVEWIPPRITVTYR